MTFDKYVIVINSSNYYQRTTSISNQTYLFNNTNIPEGNYKCRWSFKTGVETTAAFNVYPTVYLESPNSQQAFQANSTGGNTPSYCLGPARQFVNTANTTSYYFSGPDDNVNFYWNYRPNYELRIILRSGVSQTALHSGSSDYILMIEMEKIGK
jgi:hypothetical protein